LSYSEIFNLGLLLFVGFLGAKIQHSDGRYKKKEYVIAKFFKKNINLLENGGAKFQIVSRKSEIKLKMKERRRNYFQKDLITLVLLAFCRIFASESFQCVR